MTRVFLILLLLTPAALAVEKPRPIFEDTYVRQSCAPTGNCATALQSQFSGYANLRGDYLPAEWVSANWDRMLALMAPVCEKIANCQAIPGNDWVWCKDQLATNFHSVCDVLPDEEDRKRCRFFSNVYAFAQDSAARTKHEEIQACAIAANAGKPLKELEVWTVPADIPLGFKGRVTFHAVDRETRIPVMADVAIEGGKLNPEESLGGRTLTGYLLSYQLALRQLPRPDGHRNFAAPIVRLNATGFKPVEYALPVELSRMVVEMTPKTFKRGTNTVTITAKDSITGKPLEARVMGNDRVLGKTNVPFTFEWKKGQKLPEIWVTSLYDIYDDVVVLPAK